MMRKLPLLVFLWAFLTACPAWAFTPGDMREGTPRATTRITSTTPSLVGIVLKSIDKSNVYAEDGRVFPITSKTRINVRENGSGKPTALLLFRDGVLVQVIIKK